VVVKLAIPPESVTVPRVVLPLEKTIVPVGDPSVDVTLARNVSVFPEASTFGVTVSAVTGLAFRTLIANVPVLGA